MVIYHKIEQRSIEWYKIKLGKLGASRVSDIVDVRKRMALKTNDPVITKVARVISEIETGFSGDSEYQSESMEWGVDTEKEAFDSINNGELITIGGMTNDLFKYFWLSPDAISLDVRRAVEIKCFSSQEFAKNVILNKIPSKHLPQVIAYFVVEPLIMSVDFVMFDPRFRIKKIHTITAKRSDYKEEITNMGTSLIKFDELVDKNLNLFN